MPTCPEQTAPPSRSARRGWWRRSGSATRSRRGVAGSRRADEGVLSGSAVPVGDLASQFRVTGVHHDPVEPRFDVGFTGQRGPESPRSQVGLLDRLFGIEAIPEDQTGRTEGAWVALLEPNLEIIHSEGSIALSHRSFNLSNSRTTTENDSSGVEMVRGIANYWEARMFATSATGSRTMGPVAETSARSMTPLNANGAW